MTVDIDIDTAKSCKLTRSVTIALQNKNLSLKLERHLA